MSKGAFNFNTQAVSSFELARRQEYRSEAEYVYYNAQIINNSTETESIRKDPAIEYIDTRIRPVVSKVSDYTVSVENFTIDGAGKNLPLFIPQIRQFRNYADSAGVTLNRNPNDTIYDITFTWRSGGTQVIQSTRTVQWEPENLAPWASQPLPYGVYTGPQPEIAYYYCYTYSHWLKLVNAALACAWEDVKLAANAKYPSVDFGTKCPFYTYDKVTNLFSLWQDSNTCVTPYGSPVSTAPFSPTNAPNPLDVFGPSTAEGYSEGEFSFVGYNTNFEGLFTNFSTKYYGSGTPLSSSGIVLSNPLGNENCGVQLDPEVDTVVVSAYDGTDMTVTWDATPNPVPSSNWAFELPLESLSLVAAVPGSTASYTFNLTGNPVAQYLYAPLKIEGRSYSSASPDGPTGTQTSSFQGTIVSYTQSTGALVINNLSNITPVGVTGGVTGTNWKFELGPLTSVSSVKPTEDVPLTLTVNLDPTQTLVYEGTAVDLIGSSGGTANQIISGNVLSYQMSFGYGTYADPDSEIDGFQYTSASAGPTGKFNPYVVFKAQDGVFQPGDFVEGSETQATGKVIQVLSGNTNVPNTISINNLNGPFKVGDLVGLSEGAVSGLGTIIDISGPNEGTSDVVPMVRLTFSGQKNPFQINDIIFTASGAQGRITDIIGPNTGHARVAFTEQDGQFGPREYIVNTSEADPSNIGGGEIIKIEGDNTGYATATYINSNEGGAPSKFIAGEFLTYPFGGQIVSFAEVIIDNTDSTDAYGNQGNVTIKLLSPDGDLIYPPPFTGTMITGSQSGTSAEYGGISFLGTGVMILGNINGTSFLTGDRIVNISGNYISSALVSGFNYIDGGQLIVELLQGEFRLNDIINGTSSNSPELFDIEQVDNTNGWDSGNVLTWPGGAGTIFENQGLFNGASYILVNNIQGSYPVQGMQISNNNVTTNLLTLTGLTGGFIIGENIQGPSGSASVNYVSPDRTIVGLEDVSGTFNTNDIVQGSTGLSVPYTFASLEMCIIQSGSQGAGNHPPAVTVPTVSASFSLNESVKVQTNNSAFQYTTFYDGTIVEIDGSNMILNPYVVGTTFDSANSSVYLYPPRDNGTKIRYLQDLQGVINVGDKIVCENGAFGTADCVGTQVRGTGSGSWSVRLLINCGGPPFARRKPGSSGEYTLLNESTGTYITWGGRSDTGGSSDSNYCLRAVVPQTPIKVDNLAKVVTYAPNNPSTGLLFASSNSQPNAQVQTVYVDEPPNIPDTVLTVRNITGDFPIGTEIVDLGTGSGAQVTQTSFQDGLMIVQPINGTFETSDRMVGPDGSARFAEQLQQTLLSVTGSTSGTATIKEDDGTYLTFSQVSGNFVVGGMFTITSPAGTPYVGVTGIKIGVPNFTVGKEIWGRGDQGGPDFAPAIVISDTGLGGSSGVLTIGNVQTLNGIGWQGANFVAQYWSGTSGSVSSATIITDKFGFNLTMLPYSSGVTGNSWQIKPSIATSSTLATPSVNGQSVLEMNFNDNEVVFYPGDTLKVTQYEPILPVGTIFYPENVVQIDLSAGNGVIQTLQSIFPSSPDTGATYVVLVQDYESTSTLWSPVASIVVATTFIPVREEYSGQPIVLGTANNGTQGNATTASFQKDLIETPIDDIRPQVGYRGMLKYQKRVPTFTSLSLSNDDLKNLDIGMYWRNRLTNKLIPLTLFNGGSTNVRLMFKKIYE